MNLQLEDIVNLEIELKKRWQYHYHRKRIQNDEWDHLTNFIYKTKTWDEYVTIIKKVYDEHNITDKLWFFNYSANRWYNFWSAQWVENIFKLRSNVIWEKNEYHQYIDFYINWIPFDHKTSVYPKWYNKPLEFAKKNKWDLIMWLYENQSKQQRFHMKNRLFLIVHALDWEDRKIKGELSYIKTIIDNYIDNFKENNLFSFVYNQEKVLSDIIWVEK